MTTDGSVRARLGRRWFTLALLGVLLVGIAIRCYSITELRPICDPPGEDPNPECFDLFGGVNDRLYGHLQGRLIGEGHWFVNPFAAISEPQATPFAERAMDVDPSGPFVRSVGDPPLYQLYLGAASTVGLESAQSHRLLSALAGSTSIVLAALLARRLAGPRAGLVAAVLVAIHPLLWINDGMLLSEAIYAPLIALALLTAYRFRDRPTVLTALGLGAATAAAALARGEAIILLPLLVLPATLRLPQHPWRERVRFLALAAVASGALLLPWMLWINTQFEETVFMTSASGAVLSASACDQHFYGPHVGLFIYCPSTATIPPGLDESQRDQLVRRAALDYIGSHLDRLPVVVAARVGRLWDVYEPQQNLDMNIAVEDRGRDASHAGLATYYTLLPFVAAGFIAMRRRRTWAWPLVSVLIMATLTAAMTFGLTRYRVPADLVLVIVAAVGIDAIVRWLVRRRHPAPVAAAA